LFSILQIVFFLRMLSVFFVFFLNFPGFTTYDDRNFYEVHENIEINIV
jgi:hypothetical protein